MTILSALASFFAVSYVGQQIYSVALLANLVARRKKNGNSKNAGQGISVLVPIKGPMAGLEQCLLSLTDQTYMGQIELILAFQDANDPDLKIAESLQARTLPNNVSIKVLRGLNRLGFNPKNSNLIHAFKQATHPWIYCCDADTIVPREHFSVLINNSDANVYSSAISVHRNCKTLGAMLEAVGTNVEFINYFLLADAVSKSGALNGAAMFFHRDLLHKIGGFESFSNKITDDLAMQNAFAQAGAHSFLAPHFVYVDIESQTLKGFWQRQQRWQLIALCFKPFIFFGTAPFNWIGQWFILFGLLQSHLDLIFAGVAILAVRVLRSFIFQVVGGTPRADWAKCLVLPIYDFTVPFIWFSTLFVSKIKWAGQTLTVSKDGQLK